MPLSETEQNLPVIIVGGGPVGLFLALCLLKEGVLCKVLEKRNSIDLHSKSLGIHPVSLELFDKLRITGPFLKQGTKIRRGHAFIGRKRSGTLSFESCPAPFNYILTLPQYLTEEILENQLEQSQPGCLIRGAEVEGIHQGRDTVQVTYRRRGTLNRLTGRWIAGCDGKNSMVRESAGIQFRGNSYPDSYLMGDFSDHTEFGSDAAIYLHPDGLIESFPIPGGLRRWVVKTDNYQPKAERERLEQLLRERVNVDLTGCENRMMSSFGVQHFLCEPFFKQRTVLAGDAAHVVSPIGGQGMNLGWLGAESLAQALCRCIRHPEKSSIHLREWADRQRTRTQRAARRAEWNMRLGRKHRFPFIRTLLSRIITHTPLQRKMARVFTMRDLG